MPPKKKTNYISYELKKLEAYLAQLHAYLDENPPDKAEDRVKYLETARGGEMIKVIASKEQQITSFMKILQELPKLLSEINTLRKEVDGITIKDEVRGDQDRPGFMDNDIKEEEEDEKSPIVNKGLPPSSIDLDDPEDKDKFDDADYWED
jgi:hypothetical protein